MRVGPYEILSELGHGGMGSVYRARSPSGDVVALKVLRSLTASAAEKFERERRLLAALGDSTEAANLGLAQFVPLLDAGSSPNGPWIVMPLLEGGTLRHRLVRGPLAPRDALELGRALAGAMAQAHARG